MTLDEFLADHPVDRERVETYKRQMLDELEEEL